MDYDYVVVQILLLGIVVLIGVVFMFVFFVLNYKIKVSFGVFV